MDKNIPGKKVSTTMVIIAFATVYIVWGSTYFFIQVAIQHFTPMILGTLRFLAAGTIMLTWCILKGEGIGAWQQNKTSVITGLMLLFVATGGVIVAEQWLPSSLVAVLISSSPFWFVILDVPKWKENLKNRSVILGLIFGFIGVTLMFGEKVLGALQLNVDKREIIGLFILLIGTISWSGGSLYSKYHSTGSTNINTAWQMLAAGTAFLVCSLFLNDWHEIDWQSIAFASWFALIYLVVFGSIAAFTAYVWLLRVRPATQVSTYAYVNPVIAVMLGIFFAGEHLSIYQFTGLVVILGSVMLINLARYRKGA
jgi:drug/metabolite transporter (DMT)-like permease